MPVVVEITKGGVYGVVNGKTMELPIGHKKVCRAVPKPWKGRCKVLSEVSETVFAEAANGTPIERSEAAQKSIKSAAAANKKAAEDEKAAADAKAGAQKAPEKK